MNNVLENKVSCFANFYDNEPIGRALKDIVGLATSESVKKHTLDIRNLRSIANNSNTPIVQALDAKNKADNLKKNLPSFLTDVYCEHGKKRSDISSFQPFVGFDVDHITEQDTEALMELLKADPHIPIAEPSCSRTGVHFIVLTDAADWLNQMWDGKDINPYKYVWNLAKDYVEGTYNVDVDVKCMNPEHIFGICFDELIHYKDNPEPLHIDTNAYVPVCAKPSAKSNNHQAPCGSYHASMSEVENRIKKMLQSSGCIFTSGNRNNYVHRFALLCNDFGVDQNEAESYCQSYFVDSDFTATEVARTVNSAYSNTSAHGTLGLTVSATSAIPPSMGNSRNSENSAIFSTFDSNTDTGGLAEVAEMQVLPTFSDKISYDDLPPFLQEVYDSQETPVHRDKMLLGAIITVSGAMGQANYFEGEYSGIYGIYDGDRVYAPLYGIIYGKPASSKGNVKYCRYLVGEIRQEIVGAFMKEHEKYERDLEEWKQENQGKKSSGTPAPKEPEYRDFYIPGDSSAAAYNCQLCANGGFGFTFETEGDTITAKFKSDYGDYSNIWRKGFHHEFHSIGRRTEKLHAEVEDPRIAILITETPGQLATMFDSEWENGLGSRFIFYYLPSKEPEFRNVFARTQRTYEDIYRDLGKKLTPLYHALQQRKGHPLQFMFSQQQQEAFLANFNDILHEKFSLLGEGVEAMIFRFGLIHFRIAMILTALRRLSESKPFEDKPIFDEEENGLICDERDFQTATIMVEAIIEHNTRVFSVLNKELDNPFATQGIQLSQEEIKLYNALPDSEFKTKDFIDTAAIKCKVPERTAERMLGEMTSKKQIIVRIRRGVYAKVETKKP